ncbi:myosin light chain kinase 2, skeletal/cardiac muscle [Grus americana]|nr:myosin light chain kinase 2, skeletal/cardiac muscle [Grus americana]XP_054701387.1 myosin light chain kinase 2, skeletal/cardiac muscle [Grus americana]XP_054701388.1 myosin light chain kinase 2, skeletal/cardiac muscle [Grus americana]
MEQGGTVGSMPGPGLAGGTTPPEAEGGAAPAAPQAAQPQGGMVPAATEAQDRGKEEPGQEKAPAAAVAQDGGQAEPGKEKAAGEAGGGKAKPAGETTPTAPEPQDGGKAAPAKEAASTAQHGGGQAASVEEKVPAATDTQDRGKNEPGKEKALAAGEPKEGKAVPMEGKAPAAAKAQDGGKDKPREEKGPAVGKPKGGQAEPAEGMSPAVAEAQDGGKDKPRKEQAPSGLEAECGGKAEPTEEKALAAAEAEGGKAKPVEKVALAAVQAQDGGKEEPAKEKTIAPAKEKVPAAAKAPDGGKKAAKTEKTPADKKPAKEKAPATVKAQDKENQVAKAEKAPAAKKAQDGGKEDPAKEKATAPAKEKGPAAAKAQDGEKTAAKAEKTPAAKKPQDGSKEEPAKEKALAAAKVQDGGKKVAKVEKPTVASKAEDGGKEKPAKEKVPAAAKEKAPAAVKAQDGGKKAAKVEPPPAAAEAGDGGEEPAEAAATAAVKAKGEGKKAAKVEETDKQQQPKNPEPLRPALLQSLSCPATCQREEQPWVEAAVMEMIPEETTAAELKEGLTEPGPALPALGDRQPPEPPGPAGSPGTPQERTLPSAVGQHAESPGSGEQPSLTEAEPPPSPYLTPDFGKEDPFEILDDVPPPPAPFAHRIITLRSASVSSQYSLSSKEILGGGKFGEVHTCTEKETGLKLAAKVIRKQGAKDKEMVLLEIDVMNQLNHRNLIQLYDAIETPREIILFMEFVEGGELFERIVDDDYHLTEVDCMVFVRQICEGIRFMHHMRVLHLDLKPENILCVAATGHMVKIIDFGLARRYNPQEKLKVNFGTPEFLSPEVVNYEQVSYSTDMWSMGVITYMLLSGLSPFLGDNDTETLNNVLAANWYFDEETFESVSDEAKDFVSNLIIKEKSARMSAGQCLRHPWLNNLAEKAKRCNRRLKSQVLLKKYVMRRRWKKNFIGVCAANRFKKITSSGSLTALGV